MMEENSKAKRKKLKRSFYDDKEFMVLFEMVKGGKFHNQNAHVFRVLGIQKLRIVKKGTRHIYRSFMN